MTTHFKNGVTNVVGKMEVLLYLVESNNLLLQVDTNKNKRIKMTFQSTMHQIGQLHQQVDLTFN